MVIYCKYYSPPGRLVIKEILRYMAFYTKAHHQEPSAKSRDIAIQTAPAVEPLGQRQDCRFVIP